MSRVWQERDQVPEREQRCRLAAGGNSPLKLVERGAKQGLKAWKLAESGGLTDEPDQGELVGHKVRLQDGHMGGSQAVHGHALEAQPFQDAVAALGAVAAAVALFPGRAAIGDLARQPDRAIAVGATDRGGVAMLVVGLQVVTLGHRSV